MKLIAGFLVVSASALFAQTPATTEILNNYGLANPGTVAQGAIFIVKGANLSDQTTTLQSVTLQTPLQTTLVGVRLEITVAGTTTFAPMYYALPTQLAGILPSSTPTGNGTLTVRNNGRSSSPRAITVVRSAFGMLTLNGAGNGGAAVHDDAYALLNSTNSTNPGKAVIFYGSGLGPVTGDETIPQTQVNLTGIPITVTIGGKTAQVLYRGRTIYPGLDQINVMIPTLDVYGCEVPVVITTNGVQANAGTIPVAATGATCPPPASGGGGGSPNLTSAEIDTFVARTFYTSGSMSLFKSTTYSAAGAVTRTNSISGAFARASGADLGRMLRNQLPPGFPIQSITPGNCLVYNSTQLVDPYPLLTRSNLDAGAQLTAAGPNGTQFAPRLTNQVAGPTYNTPNNFPNTFVVPGRYTLSGPGGTQVGAFTGTLDVAQDFVLSNPTNFVSTISRSAPLTVSWSGGDPSTVLTIQGASYSLTGVATVFFCIENVSAGQFTVPASILSQIPATPAGSLIPGSFTVTVGGAGTRLPTPSGLDLLTAFNFWPWQFSPSFQ